MAPAATNRTSAMGTAWRRDTAARIASTTGPGSALPAPGARSATITSRSPEPVPVPPAAAGSSPAETENAATNPARTASEASAAVASMSCG